MLDSVYGGVGQRAADLQCSVEQQQQCERVLKGLQDLLELGKQRLTHTTQLEPHTTEQLHTLLSTHTVMQLMLEMDGWMITALYIHATLSDRQTDRQA